jgi:hypothetical protein
MTDFRSPRQAGQRIACENTTDLGDDSCPECHADWKRPHADDCGRRLQSAADALAACTGSRSVTYREEVRQGSIWDPASTIVTTATATSEATPVEQAEGLAFAASNDLARAAQLAKAAGDDALAARLTDACEAVNYALGVA